MIEEQPGCAARPPTPSLGKRVPTSHRLRQPSRTTNLPVGVFRSDGWTPGATFHAPSTFASTAPQGYVRRASGYLQLQRLPQVCHTGNTSYVPTVPCGITVGGMHKKGHSQEVLTKSNKHSQEVRKQVTRKRIHMFQIA